MTAADVEKIRKKIESAKATRARAEGAIDQIKKTLKEKFNVDSVDAARAMLEKMKTDIVAQEKRLADLAAQLDAAANWDAI